MKNYLNQHGCHDCARVFQRCEYDCADDFYCTYRSKRPARCGSVLENESFFSTYSGDGAVRTRVTKEEALKLAGTWRAWAKEHEVSAWGTCDHWKARKTLR